MLKKLWLTLFISSLVWANAPLSDREEDIMMMGERTIRELYGPEMVLHYACKIENKVKTKINEEIMMFVFEDELNNLYGVSIYDGYHKGNIGKVIILSPYEKNFHRSSQNGLKASYDNQKNNLLRRDDAHLLVNERTGKGEAIERFSSGVFKDAYTHEYKLSKCRRVLTKSKTQVVKSN